jgi:hypothetical protein
MKFPTDWKVIEFHGSRHHQPAISMAEKKILTAAWPCHLPRTINRRESITFQAIPVLWQMLRSAGHCRFDLAETQAGTPGSNKEPGF